MVEKINMIFYTSFIALRNALDSDILYKIISQIQSTGCIDSIKTDLEGEMNFLDHITKLDDSYKNNLFHNLTDELIKKPDDEMMRLEFIPIGSSESYQFDYSPWGDPSIDFFAPQHWFSSLNQFDLSSEIDIPDKFLVYLKCVKEIIMLTDPLLALGETEGTLENIFNILTIKNQLFGIPKPGRLTFLGREIILKIMSNKENILIWEEALKQCSYHESLCSGGELLYLGNQDGDLSEFLLTWLLEKVRIEQNPSGDLKSLRPRPLL